MISSSATDQEDVGVPSVPRVLYDHDRLPGTPECARPARAHPFRSWHGQVRRDMCRGSTASRPRAAVNGAAAGEGDPAKDHAEDEKHDREVDDDGGGNETDIGISECPMINAKFQ